MVDSQLRNAADDLTDIITDFDIVPLIEGAAGLGIGLFSAEFVAALASGMVSDQSNVVRFVTEIVAKGATTGAFVLGSRMIGHPLVMVVLSMAAVGSATSAVLQVLEATAETAARFASGETLSAPAGGSEVTQNGYSGNGSARSAAETAASWG